MASLLEIRKKIASVKNTKKITKAMQLVSTSKMKHFQELAMASKNYIQLLLEVLGKTLSSEEESSFTTKREKGKKLFILYSSDKGLCGSMNNHLFKGLINSDAWMNTPTNERELITIGKKASDMARIAGFDTIAEWKYLPEKFEMTDVIEMIAEIVEIWESKSVSEIYFVVPYFKNAFTFYPKCKRVLPFDAEMASTYSKAGDEVESFSDTKSGGYMFYEPDLIRVKDVLYTQIITGIFAESLNQLKATEYSSRMMAMQNATESAQKMIESKTLVYNKIRQQMITQQISEIVNAAEAIL